MQLSGTVVLVTGGAVRLGAAIVRAFAAAGAGVVIHHRHSTGPAAALAAEVGARGGQAWTVAGDLVNEAACESVIEESIRQAGRLDILVNSAAVFHKHSLAASSMEVIQAEWWPNLFAPWQLMRALAARQPRGRIVNILDRRIASHDVTCVPYLIGKKALAELTALAALELAPRFTVNAVAPGPILPPPGEGADYLKEHAGRIPLEIACTPEHVAEAVVYLARSDALTGNTLFVDGGQHLLGNGT
jgi:NAD(P)-dependent dehydrogenase (short-subunit alcohol dehydrogenase family)